MKRTLAHIILLAALVATALAGTAHAANRPAWMDDAENLARRDSYQLVDDARLSAMGVAGEDYLLIDARPDYEFNAGHIPGAINFEFDLGDRTGLKAEKQTALEALVGPDKNRPVVMYCRSFR